MDQLDILKSKWQSQTSDVPNYSKEQLRGLLAKKSSSIVKWLLIIAIIEFAVFAVLGFFSHGLNVERNTIAIIGKPFYYGSIILHYAAILVFIYLFYQNYRNISTVQPTRSLMNKILKTRRTMKWYIWYNLIYMMLVTMIVAVLTIEHDPNIVKLSQTQEFMEHPTLFYFMMLGAFFVVTLAMCVVLFLIYQVIYGVLLRRLKRNYNELKRMEI
ncbi:hypothetical protein [Nonlabens xiamenensis]|uniref:hypothetical protein n=1 Tax=Nonlabens xiamenensis TaxID=2341043 RepID=UPI000F60AC08|nr:hypothetical protein [Nonlabens xiamenensis]